VTFNGSEAGIAVTPGVFVGTQHETGVNPKFGVEFRPTSHAMVYATAAKGFRIGGVNSFAENLCAADLTALGLTAAQAKTFASDSLWNYEVGAKTAWLDHRLTVNGAFFVIDWANVQQQVSLPDCGFSIGVNSGSARSVGGELEIQAALTHALKWSFGAGYEDAKITNAGQFNIIPVGTPIQQVPHWTVNTALDYTVDVRGTPIFFHGDYAYVGSSLSTVNNGPTMPLVRPAYSLVNLKTGIDIQRWEISVFVDNLFDEHANLSDVPPQGIELPGRPRIAVNRPRTVGVDTRIKF
jgi:outer membrane receptor protein involved in Fe transport